MEQSVTTSLRIPLSLKKELDLLATHQHTRKNQIIIKALREYLRKHQIDLFQNDIAGQCSRANAADADESDWDQLAEESWN